MTSADEMRASDADREKIAQFLQEQVGEGRLTLTEFEERSNRAYAATTVGELRALVKDLPNDLFPQAQAFSPFGQPLGATPWQQQFPTPNLPSWQQRGVPARQVRTSPLLLIVGVLVIGAVIATMVTTGIFVLPLLFPLFILLSRFGGGGQRRRY
jgi:hypothetical protein